MKGGRNLKERKEEKKGKEVRKEKTGKEKREKSVKDGMKRQEFDR